MKSIFDTHHHYEEELLLWKSLRTLCEELLMNGKIRIRDLSCNNAINNKSPGINPDFVYSL